MATHKAKGLIIPHCPLAWGQLPMAKPDVRERLTKPHIGLGHMQAQHQWDKYVLYLAGGIF